MTRVRFLLICGLAGTGCAQQAIEVPPFTAEVTISGQPLHLPVAVSAEPAGEQIHFRVRTGLADLQHNLTPILAAAANQDNHCGERLAVRSASLDPDAPGAVLTAMVHIERWACAKAFGKEVTKRLVNGDATLRVRLTPQVGDGRSLHFTAEVISIDSQGELGDLLHSGSLGDMVREKIRSSVESALEKALDFHRDLPPSVRDIVTIGEARLDSREGSLVFDVRANAAVPAGDAAPILEGLRAYRGQQD